MSKRSDQPEEPGQLREKIIGLGERSVRKSYYPGLLQQIHALERTKEQLKQLSRRYELILQSAGEGIFGLDLDGNYTFMNKAAASMLGYEAQEILGKHSHSCIHYSRPDGSPYPEEECRACAGFRHGAVHHVEDESFCRKDGTRFPVEYTSTPIREDGAIVGAVVTFSDVTERKRAENDLRRSETNYREIFESVNDAIFVHDIDTGNVLSVNRKTVEMYGHTQEEFREFMSEALFSGQPGYTAKDAMKWIRRAAEGPPQIFEWLSKKKTGELFWVEVNLKRSVIGGETRLLAIVRDITARKRIEEEVKRTKEQLEEAQQIAGVGNWEWDVRTNKVTLSEEAYRIFNIARDQYKGTYEAIMKLVHPVDRPGIERALAETTAQRKETSFNEYRIIWPDGSVRIIHSRMRVEYDRTGAATVMRGTAQDVTEVRRAEESLKLTQFALEHASVPAFYIDKDARIRYVNEQACRGLGYSREELLHMAIPDLDPHFPHSRWGDHWEQLKKEGYLRFESEHRRKDGTIMPVDISLNYLFFGGQEFNIAFTLDITERKKSEIQLKHAFALTKTIIDSMNDSIALIDVRDFTLVDVNSAFLKNYGYTDKSQITGKHCHEITHHRPDVCSAPDDICPLIETVKSKDHFAADHVHYDKQGEKIYVEVSTSPIKDDAGNVIQVVHIQRNITERKLAEEALRISESRFRNLFKQSSISMLILSPDGRILEVNHAFEQLWGVTVDDLKEYNILEDAELTAKGLMPYIRKGFAGEATEIPVAQYDPSETDGRGITRWVKSFIYPVKREAGAIHQLVLMHMDMTQAVKAEEALRESEERFRAFFESAAVGAAEADPETRRFLRVNDRFCEITGYSREELSSKTVHDLTHPDDQEQDARQFERAKRGEVKEHSIIKRYVHKDGHAVWVDVSGSIIRGRDGRPIRAAGIIQDVTERRQAEEALRESENRFRAFFESAGVGTVQLDPKTGKFLRVNERFCRITGYSSDELRSMTLSDLTHPEDRLSAEQYAETIRPGAPVFEAEKRYVRKDGRIVWVNISATVVRDNTGNPVHTAGIVQDITARKQAEEALRRSEAFIRRVMDNLIAFVGVLTPDGVLLDVNRSALEAGGVSAEDVLGKPFEETVWFSWSPDLQAVVRRAVREAAQGRLLRFDMQVRVTGDRLMPLDFMLAPIMDEQGRITHLIPSAIDITERKRMEDEIRHLAHHDTLTGLPNRRLFNEIAGVELAQAERNKKRFAMLFLDLDRFKEINDTLGHEAGDQLLQEVAARLKSVLRRSDSIGRIGGDEFNIILADISRPDDVPEVARKLVESVRKPFMLAGHELRVTASIGISIYPDDGNDLDTLLRYSDMAMYHAKEIGRNVYQFYNPSINIRSIERMRLENMLRRSLELGEMEVYYQPLINIASGKIVCAEALLRWRHPDKGLLAAEDFIATAEETGFITEIDEWVLWSVSRQIRTWIDAGLSPLCVTVNLSARQFQDPQLVSKIEAILKETGAPAECLDIEVPESTAMRDVERSAQLMRELAAMGVHISIDDFGTGYSSLNYLKRMPIEKLKIDQSFIVDITRDHDDRAIIRAVTAMAHSMKIKVIAEGVESREQLSFLKGISCDEAQGFLFSRAVTADQFRELVESGR